MKKPYRFLTFCFACNLCLSCAQSKVAAPRQLESASSDRPTATAAVAAAKPKRPVSVKMIDRRPNLAESALLIEAMGQFVDAEMAKGTILQQAEADVMWQIELHQFGPRNEAGKEVTCARFVGRVVRKGQEFAAFDFPAERCFVDAVFSSAPPKDDQATFPGSAQLERTKAVGEQPPLRRAFQDALGELTARLVRTSP